MARAPPIVSVPQDFAYPSVGVKRSSSDILTQPLRILIDISNMEDDINTCYKAGDTCQYADNGQPCLCRQEDVVGADKNKLLMTLMEEVKSYFYDLLRVVPHKDDLLTIRTTIQDGKNCDVQMPIKYIDGIVGYDYVLFLTVRPISNDLVLAFARPCQIERLSIGVGRPTVGMINVNPAALDTSDISYRSQIGILLHEASHALGFTGQVFGMGFAHWNGYNWTRIPRNEVLKSEMNPSIGHRVERIITPEVRKAVAEHYDCPGIDGGELENAGGPSTAGSHWEKRVFENEYMTGVVTPFPIYSRITAALFKDMGWYGVNDSSHRLETLIWGKNMGCSFCNSSCTNWPLGDKKEGYRCDSTQVTQQCTFDMRGWGKCNTDQTDPLIVEPGCNFYQAYANNYCEHDARFMNFEMNTGGKFSNASRCFHSTLAALPGAMKSLTRFPQAPYMRCYATRCLSPTHLKVQVDEVWYSCPYEGGTINPVDYGGDLTCKPNAADIVCTEPRSFDSPDLWPVFTGIDPLDLTITDEETNGKMQKLTIFGVNLGVVKTVLLAGVVCEALVVVNDTEIVVNVPNASAFGSFASFGVFSSRASVVLKDAEGRTAVGRDVLHLDIKISGKNTENFFSQIGLSHSALVATTVFSLFFCIFGCGFWIFYRNKRQRDRAEVVQYRPDQLDMLIKEVRDEDFDDDKSHSD